MLDVLAKYPIGLTAHDFKIVDTQHIKGYDLVGVRLKHKKGLEHLHIDNPNDPNNVFAVAFKTNPPDATGLPHILEHTTLCGSYKYPVRDPFFKMTNRSLSNFMNAMTGHDYTYYPFATTNKKDFDNLMSVYLSSVFEPLLTHEDFMQEGWRLEPQNLHDESSPLQFKGVVYNEMKGQCSNLAYHFWIQFQQAIYPSLNNSGGDPEKMTDLQHQDLVDFHAANYHPSNAHTYSYGTFPLFEHLEKLNALYGPFGLRARSRNVKLPSFSDSVGSKEVEVEGPVDTMAAEPKEEQYGASISWYLGNPLDPELRYTALKWRILSSLLCDGHNAPFYQELIEKRYGSNYSPNAGLDITTALMTFSVGVTGLTKEKAANLGREIQRIFEEVVSPELAKGKESVHYATVEAVLHQVELSLKKHKPDFGLGLLNSLVPNWVNGVEPLHQLQFQQLLDRFKEDFNSNGLAMFEELIAETINKPTFKFTMVPNDRYNESLAEKEATRLEKKLATLEDGDVKVIRERSIKLLERQQKKDDVSVLPTVTLSDIPRQGIKRELSFASIDEQTIQKRITGTNGLVYVTAKKDLSHIPNHLFKFLPLYTSCFTNLAGTESIPVSELENRIQKHTGGISFSVSTTTDPYNIGNSRLQFVVSGMALLLKKEHVFNLWQEVLHNTKFGPTSDVVDKLSTLIRNMGNDQLNRIADRGYSFAGNYGAAKLTPTAFIADQLGGIAQVEFVSEINRRLAAEGPDYLVKEILPTLQELHKLVLLGNAENSRKGFAFNIVTDRTSMADSEEAVRAFAAKMEQGEAHSNELAKLIGEFVPSATERTILDAPFQVGYTSLAKMGAPYALKDGASLQVLSQMLSSKYLHSIIREANGAYAGGLGYDGLAGKLNFYSYRDPNAIKSAKTFKETPLQTQLKLADGLFSAKDLEEAKFAIFQSVDAPTHVASEGSTRFLEEITDEMRQERREHFLDTTVLDLQAVTEKYLLPSEHDMFTVIGDAKVLGGDGWAVKKLT